MTLIAATPDLVKARYPEMDPVSDERVAAIMLDAEDLCPKSGVGQGFYTRMTAAAVAHLLSLEGEPLRSVTGAQVDPLSLGRTVTSESIGGVSATYADGSDPSSLDKTPYGQTLRRMLKQLNGAGLSLV